MKLKISWLILIMCLSLSAPLFAQGKSGGCRQLGKDPHSKCLQISYPDSDDDFIHKEVQLDTATVYFSSSAIAVIKALGRSAVEDWSTYLVFPKVKKQGKPGLLNFEDPHGKRQLVYITGNRKTNMLEFFVIEEQGTIHHYALTSDGQWFGKLKER